MWSSNYSPTWYITVYSFRSPKRYRFTGSKQIFPTLRILTPQMYSEVAISRTWKKHPWYRDEKTSPLEGPVILCVSQKKHLKARDSQGTTPSGHKALLGDDSGITVVKQFNLNEYKQLELRRSLVTGCTPTFADASTWLITCSNGVYPLVN